MPQNLTTRPQTIFILDKPPNQIESRLIDKIMVTLTNHGMEQGDSFIFADKTKLSKGELRACGHDMNNAVMAINPKIVVLMGKNCSSYFTDEFKPGKTVNSEGTTYIVSESVTKLAGGKTAAITDLIKLILQIKGANNGM